VAFVAAVDRVTEIGTSLGHYIKFGDEQMSGTDLPEGAKDGFGRFEEKAARLGDEALSEARGAVSSAGRSTEAIADDVYGQLTRASASLAEVIRERPFTSVAVAAAVGYLIRSFGRH
jgi:ElaB/YqjD/DUF883 family membrane-anchored ribosome-binding protein